MMLEGWGGGEDLGGDEGGEIMMGQSHTIN